MNMIQALVLTGLILGVSCKTPPWRDKDIPAPAVATAKLQAGTYRDVRGGRLLVLQEERGGQFRVEIGARDAPGRFVDITALPQSLGEGIVRFIGINRVTGNQETLRMKISAPGQLQVERLDVPFPETIQFRLK